MYRIPKPNQQARPKLQSLGNRRKASINRPRRRRRKRQLTSRQQRIASVLKQSRVKYSPKGVDAYSLKNQAMQSRMKDQRRQRS